MKRRPVFRCLSATWLLHSAGLPLWHGVLILAVALSSWSAHAPRPAWADEAGPTPTLPGEPTAAPPNAGTPTEESSLATPTIDPSATLAVEGPTAASRPSATAALEAGETPASPATLTPTPTGEAALIPEATTTLTPAPPEAASPLPPSETWLPALETPTAAPEATSAEAPTPAPASSTPSATGPAPAASVTPTEAAPPTLLPEPSATSAPAVYFVLLPPPVLPDPAAAGALASIGTLPATSVLISQLYGGGGNAGAPLAHDFVELYNLSAAGVDLAGWSLQYATAAGSAWQVLPLAGVVPPGGFWLIALGSGGAAGSPGPAPDLTWPVNIAAAAGKLALVSQPAALTGACPAESTVVDFVGYGAAANCAEGAPVTGLGNAAGARRVTLIDTNQNAGDFSAAVPAPRASGAGAVLSATPSATLSPTAAPPATLPPPTSSPTPSAAPPPAAPGAVLINEVVTDPQQDWSGVDFAGLPGAGAVSETDEFVELLIGQAGLDLTGWQIELLDGSDVSGDLTPAGAFQVARYVGAGVFTSTRAGDRLVLGNVRGSGSLTNAVEVIVWDAAGTVIDRVSLGRDAPAGHAAGAADEAVARRPDGGGSWSKQAATPGDSNDAAPAPLLTATPSATAPATETVPAATVSPTPSQTPAAPAPGAVLINEVAWAGTAASSTDEWLELFNPGAAPIGLTGWSLDDGDDLHLAFPAGLVIEAGGYLLLERTDDAVVSDIPADVIYTGGLSNAGETLTLREAAGAVVDSVAAGAGWPAGNAEQRASMERGAAGGWVTHAGAAAGSDADGAPLAGTPRGPNSAWLPTPTPAPLLTTLLINEFLPNPEAGGEEFVELINTGSAPVDLSGWRLDDRAGGSRPFEIAAGTWLAPGALLALYREATGVALNNGGDSVRLLAPDGRLVDECVYGGAARAGVSWARVPDGGAWTSQGAPSPGGSNSARADLPDPPPPAEQAAAPVAAVAAIGDLLTWPVGAWATVIGRVTVPAPLFGARLLYLQDATGGIGVYLGRGDWPALEPGQSVSVLGYTRLRSGRLEFYARNPYHVGIAPPDGQPVAPAALPGVIAHAAGRLVTLTGRVVKLESSAFWLETGAGPVRVFFASSTDLKRPKVARGDVWTVTGLVLEQTATKTRAAGWQVQPRFMTDVVPVQARYVSSPAAPVVPEKRP